jgi:hypothetical protein
VKYLKAIIKPKNKLFARFNLHPSKSLRKPVRNIKTTIADDFSIFIDPEDVLRGVSELTHVCMCKYVETIQINQVSMTSHDLTSEILLAQAVVSVKAVKRYNGSNFSIKGLYPLNKDFAKLIKSIGIVDQIKVRSDHFHISNPSVTKVFRASSTTKEEVSLFSRDKKAYDNKQRLYRTQLSHAYAAIFNVSGKFSRLNNRRIFRGYLSKHALLACSSLSTSLASI